MNKITLSNFKDVDFTSLNNERANTIDDILKRRIIKESLEDKGISSFKEIKDINQISFGHFIVIEKILGLENQEIDDKVRMLSPIILRPLGELKLDNEDRGKEAEHIKAVEEEPIGNIYGAFNRFMEIRKTYLYKTYNGVIYGVLDESKDDEEEEGTNVGSTQSAREFHGKKFFWNSMISTVAGGDIFKFDQAVELMMYVVMPFFAERRSLEIIENLESKQRRI